MKIESIEIYHYRLPLDPPFNATWDPNPRTSLTSTIVRVRAGDFEGVGSGDTMLGFAGHEALFIGQDPFAIERHVQILDNLQFHYGRCWPLEIALWDLMGKITGQPLWRLLGGASAKVPVYASTGAWRPLAECGEVAKNLKALGYPAMKVRFHADNPREDIPMVQAVREAIGDEMHILVDANRAWRMPWDDAPPWDSKTAVYVTDALAELGVYWLEEPLYRHDYRGLADLRRRSKVRIAGGEGNREFAEFREYLRHGSYDVYQQDVAWSTGILRAKQMAAEIKAVGDIYSPHTWGDGLVLLANLHVSAAVANAPFIEYPYDPPTWTPERRDFILSEPMRAENGFVTLNEEPGLGVQIDWQGLKSLKIGTGTMEL